DMPLTRAEGFSLQAYLDSDALQFGAQEPVRLQAWVSDTLARMIRETPLSPDMTLEPGEEGFCLQATVRDSWQLRWWLLQQGENIRSEERRVGKEWSRRCWPRHSNRHSYMPRTSGRVASGSDAG